MTSGWKHSTCTCNKPHPRQQKGNALLLLLKQSLSMSVSVNCRMGLVLETKGMFLYYRLAVEQLTKATSIQRRDEKAVDNGVKDWVIQLNHS